MDTTPFNIIKMPRTKAPIGISVGEATILQELAHTLTHTTLKSVRKVGKTVYAVEETVFTKAEIKKIKSKILKIIDQV